MGEMVTYERKDVGYGLITLNRQEKHNAISHEMAKLLKKYLHIAKEDRIKFLVVTGAGDETFCAGGDLNELHANLSQDAAFELLYPMKDVLYELAEFPMPTICLLNGNAFGGGCELATACDFRYAKENTQHGFIQSTLGILPGWGGGTLLYEKISPEVAYQWLLEGVKYDINTLDKIGWIQKVIPADEWQRFENYLEPLIGKSEKQLNMLKKQYLKQISILSLSAKMNEEIRNASLLWNSQAHRKAVHSFMNRQ